MNLLSQRQFNFQVEMYEIIKQKLADLEILKSV